MIAATLVLVVAAAFRLVALTDIPPGLAQDEVLDADIALFIRQGEHALFFRHGYGHEPLFHYLAVPFQTLLGDNALSIRLLPAFLGILLVAGTLRWARRDYGAVAALVAGIGLAISWWPIIFSRIGIRPILEPVLLIGMIWYWPLRSRVLTRQSMFKAAWAGLFLGLALYSYTAARVMLVLPLVFLVYLALRYLGARAKASRQSLESDLSTKSALRTQAIYAFIVLLIGFMLYLPLAITLEKNPDLQQRIDQLEGPLSALRDGDVGPVLQTTMATLGAFSFTGDPRWTYSIPNRPLFDPFTAVVFYAGLLLAVLRWRQPVYAILAFWLGLALLPSALSPDAPSTVRMVGALPVVYLMPGLALSTLYHRFQHAPGYISSTRRTVVGSVAAILLVTLLSFNAYRTIRDGFINWPAELETRLRYQSIFKDIAQYRRDNHPGDAPPLVVESFYEPIDHAGLQRNLGHQIDVRWVQSGADVGGAIVWPASTPPSSLTQIFVPEFSPLPVELARLGGIPAEPAYRSPHQPSFAVYELPPQPQAPLYRAGEEFLLPGGEIILTLDGYQWLDDPENSVNEANRLHLATWWEVNSRMPEDMAIFLHLVNEQGEIVAQSDGFDAATAHLRTGDQVIQRHILSLDKSLAPGAYRLLAGIYQRDTGIRLRLVDTGVDSIVLFQCRVDSIRQNRNEIACVLPDGN